MAHAHTPGLRVTRYTTLRKVRRLPLPGRVLVAVGDRVEATEVIAATELPGSVTSLNVSREMNCQPDEVPRLMVRQVGEPVVAGDVLAEKKSLWGIFHSYVRSPVEGTLEAVSELTGQVLVRGCPTPVNLQAFVEGLVVEISADEAVTLECHCALVQGIFGLGGEAYGELKVVCPTPDSLLEPTAIDESCRGKVLVGGAMVTSEALQQAVAVGAVGLITGGMRDTDVDALLGYHLGVAVTGHENIGLTLVVTEGFGTIPMAERSYRLLTDRERQQASINGATQIRAGVIRPEVIIAHPAAACGSESPGTDEVHLNPGQPIRLIREPYFGLLATVVALPEELQQIETEARVRVLLARLGDGREVLVPRANVELIES
jgi:hypothetical protein